MKKITLLAGMLFVTTLFFAQAPALNWKKSYGGPFNEYLTAADATPDGGYVYAGYLGNSQGTGDYLILKADAAGGQQWQTSYGGVNTEDARDICTLPAGGYIVAGTSNSIDEFGSQAWALRLNADGGLGQQIIIGGGSSDAAMAVEPTADGGSIIAGYTASADLFPDIHGSFDAMVVKLNSQNVVVWQKVFGGSLGDVAVDIKQTADGGFIVACTSGSADGDVTGNHGHNDIWVCKLSEDGSLLWQKSYGGTEYEEPYALQLTPDGGCIVAGRTNSIDGDVTGQHGSFDAWVIKLDALGSLQWQKTAGGTMDDLFACIAVAPDGGYLVGGSTGSADGDVTGFMGISDGWVVKLTATGDLEWQKTYGGTGTDYFNDMIRTPDEGIILAGGSTSSDFDVPENNGGLDAWAIKLGGDISGLGGTAIKTLSAYPNPVADVLYFSGPLQSIRLFTPDGKQVLAQANVQNIDVSRLAAGLYFAEMEAGGKNEKMTFIKK